MIWDQSDGVSVFFSRYSLLCEIRICLIIGIGEMEIRNFLKMEIVFCHHFDVFDHVL